MSSDHEKFERVLITGATGFIGRHLIELISESMLFDNVRILVRKSSDQNLIDSYKKKIPDLEVYYGDLTEFKSLESSLQQCDSVINLAAYVTYKNSPKLTEVNVKGVRNLCEAASKLNIFRLVHVSSTAALGYSNDKNTLLDESSEFPLSGRGFWYAESKFKGDKVALDYYKKENLPVVICMPSEVYGEFGYETAKNLVDLSKSPIAWDGGTSVVYVKDVAKGLINALFKGRSGEKYILGSENLTITQIVEKVLKFTNSDKRIIQLPNFLIEHPIKYLSLLFEKVGIEPIFDPSVIKYATKYWFVSSSKARQEIGFCTIDANNIFSNTINWLRRDNLI